MDRQIVLHDADGLSVWIVQIDEFAHAFGIIFRCTPLGDFDLTPEPIGIEDNEEIGGAVAAILVVVSLRLAR